MEPGRYHRLRIVRLTDRGALLDGGNSGEILLPRRLVEDSMQAGDSLEVFVHHDSEDRLTATTQRPAAVVGECAYLKVVALSRFGAFLDWGLPKDLLVPRNEQHKPMQKGYSYVVYLYIDRQTGRIAASSKLEHYLELQGAGFKTGQAVDCLIYGRSDLGFKAVIDGTHLGQFYDSETFRPLHYGERVGAFIRQIRADGKIDLVLQRPTERAQGRLEEVIMEHLRQRQGISTLTDSSPPAEIYQAFGVSKANYKRALGRLYRQRKIVIEKHRITLA